MSDETQEGFFDLGEELADKDSLQQLNALAEKATEIEEDIEELESMLDIKKKNLAYIKSHKMPDIMAACGLTSVDHDSRRFTLTHYVSGSFPKEGAARDFAVATLAEYGGEGLMVSEVSVKFGKGSHNEFHDLRQTLADQGYPVEAGEKVNTASLHALCRRRLEDGLELDGDALGITFGRIVKTTKATGKKRK